MTGQRRDQPPADRSRRAHAAGGDQRMRGTARPAPRKRHASIPSSAMMSSRRMSYDEAVGGEGDPLRVIPVGAQMNKVYPDTHAALAGLLRDGMTIMSGGFGLCGIPEQLIASYVGENKLFEQLYLSGELDLEFNPQGTLAERIRAGGAGIPAFYTKTGVGTLVAEGKEIREFDGEKYVMERGLVADLAIIHAWKGDTEGNLVYRKTARNFNPIMATAARVTVAEVEHLVEPGQIDPDHIHTPGIFVKRIVRPPFFEKRIEQRTVRR